MEIIFIMDDTLRDYLQKYDITVGLYHYSLRLANPHKVILRRMKLFESFTQPYNTMLLKAFDGRIQILPVFSNNEWLDFLLIIPYIKIAIVCLKEVACPLLPNMKGEIG